MHEHSLQPHTMDVIPEETSRICSDPNLKDITQDSPSLDLIIQAYERIRSLQEQNEELHRETRKQEEKGVQIQMLRCEIQKLKQAIKDRDLRIQNLQKISEKAIMDYVKIERQLQLVRLQSGKIKRNMRLSSQVNSPLHPVIVNTRPESYMHETPSSLSPCSKLIFQPKTQSKKQPLRFKRNQQNQNICHEFTFDARPRNTHSPNPNKILKNCFSTVEMTKLVNKVHNRHESILKNQQSQIYNYQNYCSSIQKKYSQGLSLKNQQRQMNPFQTAKNSCSGSPKNIQFKIATFGEKNWDLTNTTSSYTAASFGKSRDNRSIKIFS